MDSDTFHAIARAHRAWAKWFAPWLLRPPTSQEEREEQAGQPDEYGFVRCPVHDIAHHQDFECCFCRMDAELAPEQIAELARAHREEECIEVEDMNWPQYDPRLDDVDRHEHEQGGSESNED